MRRDNVFKLLQHFSENFRDNNSSCVEKGERKKPFDYTRAQKNLIQFKTRKIVFPGCQR